MADPTTTRSAGVRRRRWGGWVAVLLVVWVVAGVRQLDPDSEIGVLDGTRLGLGPFVVDGGWAVAPPGLLRLRRYPMRATEIRLPDAKQLDRPGPDGGRYGLRGTAIVEAKPELWRRLHAAAGGRGLDGVMQAAVARIEIPLPAPWRRGGRVPGETAARIEERLRGALERRGLTLKGLRLEGYDFLTVADEQPVRAISSARLLLLGLDGADWEVIDPLIERGRLPNIEGLIRNGVRAKLRSISPMLSPVIWTSMATGVEPSRHGILDFLVPDPAGGPGLPVTSRHRQVASLWQVLSRHDVRVGVIGWWASWPAEQVNGYLVSDRVAYQLFGYRADLADAEGKAWPAELYTTHVRPAIIEPESIAWSDIEPYLRGTRRQPEQLSADERERLEEFRTLLASGRTYLDLALTLRREHRPAFEAVYFEGTDTIGHLFMGYRPPHLAGVDRAGFETFQAMVDEYYVTVDGYIGRLLEDRGDDWTVMLVSDHGFVTDESRPRTTDSRIGHGAAADWHRRFGVLVLSGAHVQAGAELGEATVYDVAPTVLALFGLPVPASWPGQVLAPAMDPALFDEHPVRFRLSDPVHESSMLAAADDPTAAAMLEKLESLGYIGAGSDEQAVRVTARNNTGVTLMAEGRYAEAEAEFRAALGQGRANPAVLVNLGIALRMQGKNAEARQTLEQALRFQAARSSAGHQLAEMSLDSGDLAEAERRLRQVLEWEPGAAESRTALGLVLEHKGDLAGAEAEYRRAAELDSDAALARSNLGNLARRAGRQDEAERWYRAAIAADPYFMGAYNNLALLYQDRGQPERAIELYSRALEKAPGNAIVLNNLASLYYSSGNLAEAERVWEKAIRADPKFPSPYNNLAGLAIAQGRLEDAEALLRQALELNGLYGDAHINLALVHRRRGDPEHARQELQLALRDARARRNALVQLGALELEHQRPEKAADWFLEALETDRADTVVLNALGQAYWLLGRRDQALGLWRESLNSDPTQERLRQELARLEAGS